MNTFEESATRYQLIKALTANLNNLKDNLQNNNYKEGEKEFLNKYIKKLEKEITNKSTFTLKEAIDELGFCYDKGLEIRSYIDRASNPSYSDKNAAKELEEIYNSWFLSIVFVFKNCDDIYDYYEGIFINATPQNISSDNLLNLKGNMETKLDKLEEIMIRLENKDIKNIDQKVQTDNPSIDYSPDKIKTIPQVKTKVEISSYDTPNGILKIGGKDVKILCQPNRKGEGHETKEARVLRLLFNDVKHFSYGIPMRNVLSVREGDFTSKHRKLVKSYVTEINKKISDEVGINGFLICNQLAVFINDLYRQKN